MSEDLNLIIKKLETEIVEYEFSLQHLNPGNDDGELVGFCRGMIKGLKYTRNMLKEIQNAERIY